MKIKSGYVAIAGKPNVGKSTFMNALLGTKLSITTNKAQTTRKRILGILDEDNYQIIFIDTPGILHPKYLLQKRMVEYIGASVKDADVLLFMIDIASDPEGNSILKEKEVKEIIEATKAPKILLINKIDLSNEISIGKLFNKINNLNIFKKIIPISATLGANIQQVKDVILEYLPVHPKYYPDDQLSDANERFFVAEIIREKIFEFYREEIPYSTEVIIDEFKERKKGKDFISAVIIVERDSQKPIIIGKKGESIKKLGKIARASIEEFLQRPVYLEVRVKVRNKWRSDPLMLKRLGYNGVDEK
ncbi:GTPase Era [bacterium BMS3Abin04]|nr:GTPase Era [bacterium BMS3Abin04]